ncbi:MAG: hypothetical protein QOE09_2000 [Ilumatobacteraceae bacterium]|jgi:hypothetical protein
MSTRKQDAALVGVGVVACAACCAGPIIGFLAAIGFGTAAGVALFGTIALVFGAVAFVLVLGRRRRSRRICEPGAVPGAVPVEMSAAREPQ